MSCRSPIVSFEKQLYAFCSYIKIWGINTFKYNTSVQTGIMSKYKFVLKTEFLGGKQIPFLNFDRSVGEIDTNLCFRVFVFLMFQFALVFVFLFSTMITYFPPASRLLPIKLKM